MNNTAQHRITRATIDPDAKDLNHQLNSVAWGIAIGRKLKKLYLFRFAGNPLAFRRRIRDHLDCSVKTAVRYLMLAEHANILEGMGVIDWIDAYRIFDIAGAIPADSPVWEVTA